MNRAMSFALVLLLFSAAGPAWADGAVLGRSHLPHAHLVSLESGIAKARTKTPEAFRRIRSLRGHRKEVYTKTRGQRPSVAAELQALGPGGLWALIDAIAVTELPRGDANDKEWRAVQVGLVTALGELRAPESSEVLRAIFSTPTMADELRRAAAIGLGKLGGPGERALLIKSLSANGARRAAALWGLRHVRRPDAVAAVATVLRDSGVKPSHELAAMALGFMGSSWAWGTGRAGRPQDEDAVRRRCAEALVSAYVTLSSRARERAARSLSMVEHRSTLEMIEREKGGRSDNGQRSELESLRARLVRGWSR